MIFYLLLKKMEVFLKKKKKSCIIKIIDSVEYFKIGNNRKDIYNMRMFIVFLMFRNCFY